MHLEETEIELMRIAINEAKKGIGNVNPNPLVGAVIVKNGKIISKGYHHGFGMPHAEVDAIENAQESIVGADLYVNLEPCSHHGKTPPCCERITKEKIARVFVGMRDPNPLVAGNGVQWLRNHGVEVIEGVCEKEAMHLNRVFIKYITTKLPYVTMKYAMTLDGKIATSTGESQWISCEKSREDAHRLRNSNMAIMVGRGTLEQDNPSLNCRLAENVRQPYKIILDSNLSAVTESCNIWKSNPEKVIVATLSKDSSKIEAIKKLGGDVIHCIEDEKGMIDIPYLLKKIGEKRIDSILCDGGGELNGSLLLANAIDEAILYIAPKLFGGKAPSPIGGCGVTCIDDALDLDIYSTERIEEDIVVRAKVKK